jgi:hypothetical protein
MAEGVPGHSSGQSRRKLATLKTSGEVLLPIGKEVMHKTLLASVRRKADDIRKSRDD